MNIKRGVLLLCCCFVIACNETAKEKPPIPMPEMEKILIDLHLAEAYSTELDTSANSRHNKNIDSLAVFYKDVFAHHGITTVQFKKGMEWYKAHPAELDSCYKHMTNELARMEGSDTTKLK